MTDTATDPVAPAALDRLVDAILPHVAFDGWSEPAFAAAAAACEMSVAEARLSAPRGALDLAVAFHRRGDRRMVEALGAEPLEDMRFRDRVARAVRLRLDVAGDREAVRRGTALFALPIHAAEGSRLIWGTADAIWTALGDNSDDVNWYTKRATLSGVYGATVLYWLGDDSLEHQATEAFVDRRIEDVMTIEKLKAQAKANPVLRPVMAQLDRLGALIKPPRDLSEELPGRWTLPRG